MVGNRYSNAIWQLHMDFLIKKASRISLNYLIDEFVFDPNIELNKDHGEAFFLRISTSVLSNQKDILICIHIS